MSRLFLSHIHEEAEIARVLKDWIEGSFPGQIEVFVSSDERSLRPGERWLERIDQELDSATIFVVLCSPTSIRRPWINFETGAGWVKGTKVIPVCHSGLARGDLPLPLSAFQGLDLEEEGFPRSLMEALAPELGLPRAPPIDAQGMQREMIGLIESLQTQQDAQAAAEGGQPAGDGELDREFVRALQLLADANDELDAAVLADRAHVGEQRMQYVLDELLERGLVHDRLFSDGRPSLYYLTPAGRRALMQRGLLL